MQQDLGRLKLQLMLADGQSFNQGFANVLMPID